MGAFLSTLICGYFAETQDWTIGFGIAGAGMLLGLLTFGIGKDRLQGHGEAPNPDVFARNMRDLGTPELAETIERYYRGTSLSGPERIKLFKLVWDAMYSEFAGRHALYERNYAGNQDQQRLDILRWSEQRGDTAGYRALVDECLASYDTHGWLAPHLR